MRSSIFNSVNSAIMTRSGSIRLETLKAGDQVLTRTGYQTVTEITQFIPDDIFKKNHPPRNIFWTLEGDNNKMVFGSWGLIGSVLTEKGYELIEKLKPGDRIITKGEEIGVITAIEKKEWTNPTYKIKLQKENSLIIDDVSVLLDLRIGGY